MYNVGSFLALSWAALTCFLGHAGSIPECNRTKVNQPAPNTKCGEVEPCAEISEDSQNGVCAGEGIFQKSITWNYCSGGGTYSTRCDEDRDAPQTCTERYTCMVDEVPNPVYDPEWVEHGYSEDDIEAKQYFYICVAGELVGTASVVYAGSATVCEDKTPAPSTSPEEL